MRWSSKYTGIGNCERQWGHLKHLKTGKRSHLSARAVEMQSIIYSTARINEARIRELEFENNVTGEASRMWSDDDINFDLMLENFGADTTVLRCLFQGRESSNVGLRIGRRKHSRRMTPCRSPGYCRSTRILFSVTLTIL